MLIGLKRAIGNSKGAALLFTMFFLIGFSMMVATDYRKGLQRERQIAREIKRVQAKGIEKFVLDRGVRFLKDYVQSNSIFPAGTGTTQINAGCCAAGGLASNETFQTGLSNELAAFKTRMAAVAAGLPIPSTIPWLANMNIVNIVAGGNPPPATVDFINSNNFSTTSQEYMLTFAIQHTGSQAQQRICQRILVNLGKLYDYSIFYSGDLEVEPTSNWKLDGPIYATGDVYLTPAHNVTLTIEAPPLTGAGAWVEPYALQSSGNIYFGPKRSIAQNYFLSGVGCSTSAPGNCFNQKYAKGIREELRTNDPNYYSPADTVEVFPDNWYRGQPYFQNFRAWADFQDNGGPAASQVQNPLPPYFYYFMNQLRYDGTSTHTINIVDSTGVNQLASYTAPSRTFFPSWTENTSGTYSYLNRTYYTDSNNYNGVISISSAYDINNPPQLVGTTGSDRKPVTNPNWIGCVTGGVKAVWDNSPTTGSGTLLVKNVVSGDPGSASGTHVVIEPFQAGDSAVTKTAKIQWMTNVRVLCTDATCSSYYFETWKKSAAGVFTSDLLNQSGLPPGVTASQLTDFRLGFTMQSLQVDVQALSNYALSTRNLTTDNSVAVYLQTNTGPYSTGATTALVVVTNGQKLPQGGFTVVTNGRVWVQGNYNTYDYTQANYCTVDNDPWVAATCTNIPPAAFFSDSFGVLSNQWNAGSESLGLSPSQRPAVTGSVFINAAIITGDVPSQLVEAYSSCTGVFNGHVSFNGCNYSDNSPGFPNLKVPQRAVWTANSYWAPQRSYLDAAGTTFNCPDGLQASGQPVNPGPHGGASTCEYWLDDTTGIYYYNQAQNTNWNLTYGAHPAWNIPLFGAANALYTQLNASPYAATLNFGLNDMVAAFQFPGTPIPAPPPSSNAFPASSVFPGMSTAWTLSEQNLYGVSNYTPLGATVVTVDPTNPETTPLSLNPFSGSVSTSQGIQGPNYLGDFGYNPLWSPMYSGGLENLINLQEAWNGQQLNVRGSLVRLWNSVSLQTTKGLAFYNNTYFSNNTSYYTAPVRNYYFNPSLRTTPPPASPYIIEVKVGTRDY